MKNNLFISVILQIKIMNKKQILHLSFFLLIVFSFTFFACKKDSLDKCDGNSITTCTEDPSKANIRIKNNSKYDFCAVVLSPPARLVNCGRIKKGEKTCYHAFDQAYNYAYIKLYIEDKEFVLQPIDYTGEVPLDSGKYTYILDISDFNARRISLTLQRD